MSFVRWTYILISLYFLLLVACAIHSRIDLYDSFENLNSSVSIAAGRSIAYSPLRSQVTPLLILPGIIVSRLLHDPWLGILLSRLTIQFLSFLGFVGFYLLLRRKFSLLVSFGGAAALAINPLVIMMALVVKEDIPALALLILGSYFYFQKKWTKALVIFAFAGWARWNNVVVPGAIVAGHMLLNWYFNRKKSTPPIFLFAVTAAPFLLLLLLAAVVYPWIGASSLTGGIHLFLEQARAIAADNAHRFEPVQVYLYAFAYSVSIPLLLLMALGVKESLRIRTEEDLFFISWLVVFFALLFIVISHREPRYILSMLPAVYYFIAGGFQWIENRFSKNRQWILFGFAICPVFFAGKVFAQRWNDPVFSLPFESSVSDYAKDLAQGNAIWWRGVPYALVPKEFLFCPYDQVTNVFHFDAHVVSYFAGETAHLVRFPVELDFGTLKTGDVVIWNSERYMTADSISSPRLPLIVFRAELFEASVHFGLLQTNAPDGVYFLFGKDNDPASISLYKGVVKLSAGRFENFKLDKFPEAAQLHLMGQSELVAFKTMDSK